MAKQDFEYKNVELCGNCHGTGWDETGKHRCPTCDGTGRIYKTRKGTVTVEPYKGQPT